MKVLFLNTEKGWRGGERQTFLAMKALRSLGVAVDLVARPGSPIADAARSEGFTVHTMRGFFSIFMWVYLSAADYEVLHAHTAFTASVLAVVRLFKKQPVFFTRRTDFNRPSKAWLRRIKWQQFDQLIAISRAAAHDPVHLGLTPIIVRSAVPIPKENPSRLQTFLEQHDLIGKTLVGTASIFNADKDPLTCIHAAAALCARNPDVVFLHWGAGGELEAYCRNYVRVLKLERHYLFLGFVANPEELYPCLSAFISTSRIEALGTSVLDAMVQTVPVVATSVGGLRETLDTGRGILVPPESPVALSEALERVLDSPADAQQMTARAYAYVREEHNVSKLAKSYVEIYSKFTDQVRLPALAVNKTA